MYGDGMAAELPPSPLAPRLDPVGFRWTPQRRRPRHLLALGLVGYSTGAGSSLRATELMQ
jgi:hypothetical protein